jgi:hypothetical protein
MADKSTANSDVPYCDEPDDECSPQADTELDRQLLRTEFRGNTSAIIYPRDDRASKPVRCTVQMRDLSDAGFGITHTEMLRPKQRIELELGSKCLVGEVQWCRPIQVGLYIVGCRIIASE